MSTSAQRLQLNFGLFYSEVSNEGKSVKINYFEDTDTAFIEFTSGHVAKTRELCENIHIDLDEHGNLVSMKVEHAKKSANILELTFERQEKRPDQSV